MFARFVEMSLVFVDTFVFNDDISVVFEVIPAEFAAIAFVLLVIFMVLALILSVISVKFRSKGPLALMVKSPVPLIIKLLSNVIVLPLLSTPVPPIVDESTFNKVKLASETFALFDIKVYGTDQSCDVPISI